MSPDPSRSLPPLVSATWLAARLGADDLVILDVSWYLPAAARDPEAEYRSAHIPGAVRVDMEWLSAPDTDLPHMLPTPEQFAELMERIGVRPTDRVICYDGSGVNLSAARAWWTFRVFGHHNVAVLDGGFPVWAAETRPVQRRVTPRARTGYHVPTVDRSLIRDRADIERMVASGAAGAITDCRPALRFQGEQDEPRPGLRRGNIPGSRNLPFSELTDPATHLFRSPAELRALMEERGIDVQKPIVALCGSGTSACALALAVEVLRASGQGDIGPPVAIYDASWAEWGR